MKLNIKQLIIIRLTKGCSLLLGFKFPLKEECLVFWFLTKYLWLTSLIFRIYIASVTIFFTSKFVFPFFPTIKTKHNWEHKFKCFKKVKPSPNYIANRPLYFPDLSAYIYNLLYISHDFDFKSQILLAILQATCFFFFF